MKVEAIVADDASKSKVLSEIQRYRRLEELAKQVAEVLSVAQPQGRAILAAAVQQSGSSVADCARRHHPLCQTVRQTYWIPTGVGDKEAWALSIAEFAEAGFAIRHGEIQSTGAYFATPGWSTYYDERSERVSGNRYDLTGLRIADPSQTEVGFAILGKALEHPDLTPAHVERLRELISEYSVAEGVIHYMDNDSLPLPWAASELGWDGILVWENDDIWSASSVFVWAVDRVDKVCSNHRAAIADAVALGLPVPEHVRQEHEDTGASCSLQETVDEPHCDGS